MNIIKLADAVEAILTARLPDGYEIMTGHSATLSIEAKEGKVDTFKSAEPVGVSIRLLKNGCMGFSYSSSFAPIDLEKMVDNALTGALSQCADEANILPDPLPFRAMPERYVGGVAEVELARKIERALESVPETLRELFVLRHVNEFSYEEIADIKGLPVGTVKNRVFQAKELLRKQMEAS